MKQSILAFFLCCALSLSAQSTEPQQYKFRVYLKDKGNTELSLSEPEKFLSEQSIERKKRQNVAIDASDLPISSEYFQEVTNAGAKVVSHSKWFKTIVVQVEDSVQISDILRLSFVDSAKYVWRGREQNYLRPARPRLGVLDCMEDVGLESHFGITDAQFAMHNAKNMALSGFTGKGVNVAVIDAGFTNADVVPQFSGINLGGFKSFVPGSEIFASSDHGTKVFSTMAVNLPHIMMGSAPHATYHLLVSEDVRSEFPVEEDYWVRAVEYADSIGIDVINTSLGYSTFDDKSLNYSHDNLNGTTSIMSLAADKAFDKGMVLVISAGNEGNKRWQKTTPPADAKNILSVGAVATDSIIASFSSHGVIADGRIKPEVVSVGHHTITIGQNGMIGTTNGTSLSSPFLAGLVASLWSVNPDLDRKVLMEIIKKSSDRYQQPDTVYGYGIPDFGKAMKQVLEKFPVTEKSLTDKYFTLNRPAKTSFLITLTEPDFSLDAYAVNLLDEAGNLLSTHRFEENSLNISIPAEVRKKNKFLHLVFTSPYTEKTLRVKL